MAAPPVEPQLDSAAANGVRWKRVVGITTKHGRESRPTRAGALSPRGNTGPAAVFATLFQEWPYRIYGLFLIGEF